MSDSPRPDHTMKEQILAVTMVGYAVIGESDELLSSNLAFDEIAESTGVSPQQYARQLANTASGNVESFAGPSHFMTVRSLDEPPARLIELIPTGLGRTEVSDRIELDEVTGVLSRQAFLTRLVGSLSNREAQPFALVFLDLDGFKSVNDRYGHLVGDACLKEVGRRLSAVVRGDDLVGRFGGDEFLILLHGVDGPARFSAISGRLHQSMETQFDGPGGPIQLGASLGVAYPTDGNTTVEGLINAADQAMYASKRQMRSTPR